MLELDFYRADTIAALDDDAVARLALRAAAAALELAPSALPPSMLRDAAVVRAREAVSLFATGSFASCPGGVALGGGAYVCGDWVDRAGHASWSTEKSVVTARQAAGAIARDFGLRGVDDRVAPVREDPAVVAARRAAKAARSALRAPASALPPRAPWASRR